MTLHLDDEDAGLSPSTSHPRFVELAPVSFYDEGAEFTPFGNDDGHDALRELEAWYVDADPGADPADCLSELLDDWDLDVPDDVLGRSDERLLSWVVEEDEHDRLLAAVAHAHVAVALGQLKIVGDISPALLAGARQALHALRVVTADTSRYPDWPSRDEALAGLADVERVLSAVAR